MVLISRYHPSGFELPIDPNTSNSTVDIRSLCYKFEKIEVGVRARRTACVQQVLFDRPSCLLQKFVTFALCSQERHSKVFKRAASHP